MGAPNAIQSVQCTGLNWDEIMRIWLITAEDPNASHMCSYRIPYSNLINYLFMLYIYRITIQKFDHTGWKLVSTQGWVNDYEGRGKCRS